MDGTYNRIFMLEDLVRDGFRGWAIYMDADAFMADMAFDLRSYLNESQQYCLIGGPGSVEHTWNINAGIFFIDLRSSVGREIVNRWRAMFDERVPVDYLANPAAKWDDYPNDQGLLHEVVKTDCTLTMKTKKEDHGVFSYRDGRYIKQAIRAGNRSVYDRVEWLRAETRKVLALGALPYIDLTALANKYGSDKGDVVGNKHGYTQYYQFLFDGFRHKRFDFLEIGLLRGGPEVGGSKERAVSEAPSVQMWLEYFPHAYCHGFDINDFSGLDLERFRFHRGDMGVPGDYARLKSVIRPLRFIIDDASHASYHQQLGFAALFSMVESGGYYIIEDLDWRPEAYEPNLPACRLTRDVFERFTRSGILDSAPVSPWDAAALADSIGSVQFVRRRGDGMIKMVVVRKR